MPKFKLPEWANNKWLRRLWQLVKYLMSAGAGTVLDYAVFFTLHTAFDLPRTPVYIGARLSGAVINFLLNRFMVFKKRDHSVKSFLWDAVQYALLSVVMAWGALHVLNYLADHAGLNLLLAKPAADTCMFALGYVVQRYVIFRRKKPVQTNADGKQNQ